MPCIIHSRFDELTPQEQAAVYKAVYWSDNITDAEWPVVLGHEEATAPNKSRLKKKAAGWLMGLARIHYLNPELFAEIAAKADDMYREQIEDDSLLLQTARMLAEKTVDAPKMLAEDDIVRVATTVKVWNQPSYEGEEEEAA
jgi:hypothetical protein